MLNQYIVVEVITCVILTHMVAKIAIFPYIFCVDTAGMPLCDGVDAFGSDPLLLLREEAACGHVTCFQ